MNLLEECTRRKFLVGSGFVLSGLFGMSRIDDPVDALLLPLRPLERTLDLNLPDTPDDRVPDNLRLSQLLSSGALVVVGGGMLFWEDSDDHDHHDGGGGDRELEESVIRIPVDDTTTKNHNRFNYHFLGI